MVVDQFGEADRKHEEEAKRCTAGLKQHQNTF